MPAGLRYGQIVANLDFSREFELGLASPLSVAVGVEYRNENFKIRPGDSNPMATGPLFRASFATTAANCARSRAFTMPAPASAASRAGPLRPARRASRGIPAASATDESRHS